MARYTKAEWRRVADAFERSGLLPAQHRALPCVASLVVGAPLAGSWLAHPRCHAIYDALGDMEAWPGACIARLVDEHVSYVHPRLVPALHVVAASGEAWQRRGLSPEAGLALTRLRRAGSLRTDAEPDTVRRRALAKAVNELESRLLVQSEEIHGERGQHAKIVRLWEAPTAAGPSAEEGRRLLEEALGLLAAQTGSTARLPWQARRGHRGPRPTR